MTPYHESDGVTLYGAQRGYWMDWRITLYDEAKR